MAALGIVFLLALAAFPFSLMKSAIATRIGKTLGSHASIASVERRELVSFTPTVIIHELAIDQPHWAGKGRMLRARQIDARLNVLSLLFGKTVRPKSIIAHSLDLALVRDRHGRANWKERDTGGKGTGDNNGLRELIIPDGHISVRDDKRFLRVAGGLTSDERGLRVNMTGQFHDRSVRLDLRGGRIADLAAHAPYPFQLAIESPLLRLQARGLMQGALNMRSMTFDMHVTAANLKYLDHVIEAGLFGTNPIDLSAHIRHEEQDWFVEPMRGRIGRSPLSGKASILKRDGRTKIDGDIRFAALDFDDLSDAHGRAKAETVEDRIGERVLPRTHISLSKVGPTDGMIRFRADRLLLDNSAFRSLAGVIRLDGKLLTIDDMVMGMASGRMTGGLRIDQRGGAPHPRLSINFRLVDDRLERLLGTNDAAGPMRGRIILSGTGDTIRDAFAHADGRIGLIVRDGSMKRTLAAMLGQDLGKTIGAALNDKEASVPLRCLAVGFTAHKGKLMPAPLVLETGISTGQGRGELSLATEEISLSLNGRSHDPSGLRLTDPIRVGGTFSHPAISISGKPAGAKMGVGIILGALGKSIGRAMGIAEGGDVNGAAVLATVNCPALARKLL